jgi:hypothetical protein
VREEFRYSGALAAVKNSSTPALAITSHVKNSSEAFRASQRGDADRIKTVVWSRFLGIDVRPADGDVRATDVTVR